MSDKRRGVDLLELTRQNCVSETISLQNGLIVKYYIFYVGQHFVQDARQKIMAYAASTQLASALTTCM